MKLSPEQKRRIYGPNKIDNPDEPSPVNPFDNWKLKVTPQFIAIYIGIVVALIAGMVIVLEINRAQELKTSQIN